MAGLTGRRVAVKPAADRFLELVASQARTRLLAACLVVLAARLAGAWLLGVLGLGPPTSFSLTPVAPLSIDILLFTTTAVTLTICVTGRISPSGLIAVGHGFGLLIALTLALAQAWAPGAAGGPWLALWILVFPLLVPGHPLLHLVTLGSAAAMPVVVAVGGWWADGATGASGPYLPMVVPGLAATVVALIAAETVHHFARHALRMEQELHAYGGYRLVKLLGEGGMGQVWLARHRLLARPAAVKLISTDSESVVERPHERFEREAKATAALSSPHTVTVFDYGVGPDGDFYYVMELLDGLDLDQAVIRYGPMPPGRVLHLLLQACDSLGEAHSNGLVHRDVKPGNLFICRAGMQVDVLKVLDFGLVIQRRQHRVGEEERLTQQGFINGTPGFMSPEQVRDEKDIDGRSDLYALGCLAWWLLTASVLFDDKDDLVVLDAHCHQRPPSLAAVSPFAIPEPFEQVVKACLAKRRENRPRNARHLAQLLRDLGELLPWSEAEARGWWQRHGPVPVHRSRG